MDDTFGLIPPPTPDSDNSGIFRLLVCRIQMEQRGHEFDAGQVARRAIDNVGAGFGGHSLLDRFKAKGSRKQYIVLNLSVKDEKVCLSIEFNFTDGVLVN